MDRLLRYPPRFQLRSLLIGTLTLLLAMAGLSACSTTGKPMDSIAVETSPTENPMAQLVTPVLTVPPTLTPVPTETTVPSPTPEMINGIPTSPEQTAASNLLAAEPGVYGFAVLNDSGKIVVSYNAETPFVTASLYKLVVMADILNRVEQGELSLDQLVFLEPELFVEGGGDMYFANEDAGSEVPISDLLFAAGAFSSNVSGQTLLQFTDPESLRATAERIGMDRTYILADPQQLPFWPPQPAADSSQQDIDVARGYVEESAQLGPVNVTTPLDMARYQLALTKGEVISPWVSQHILEILDKQLIRDRIPFLMPDNVRVINKPGNLEDVVNDTGILYLPSGTRTLAVLSEGVPDDDHATLILQRLALIATGDTAIPPIPEGTPINDWT